ncbi:Ribosomal RNA small subunit methyltransferase A [bacterium AB1]|nr:Ribosomal RNA small subunit methyltransferase A [bacterium AB1]
MFIKPHKSKGQNFLNNSKISQQIVDSSYKGQYIIEVGPGIGALTDFLIKKYKKIFLIEVDLRIVENLKKQYMHYIKKKQIIIYHCDVLLFDFNIIFENFNIKKNISIISNLPFNIIKKFFEKMLKYSYIDKMTLMLQYEFLEMIENKINAFGYLVNIFFKHSVVTKVKKNFFTPSPKVDAIVMNFEKNFHNIDKHEEIYSVLKLIFTNKRKILKNIINNIDIPFINLDFLHKRPHELTLKQFYNIYYQYKNIFFLYALLKEHAIYSYYINE